MSDKLSDQAAQALEQLICTVLQDERYEGWVGKDSALIYAEKLVPALLALMYRENLAVIGPEEPESWIEGSIPKPGDRVKVIIRNQLRAEQRQAAAQRYGQPEPEKK